MKRRDFITRAAALSGTSLIASLPSSPLMAETSPVAGTRAPSGTAPAAATQAGTVPGAGHPVQVASADAAAPAGSTASSTASSVARPELLPDARPMASRLGLDRRIWNWHSGGTPDGTMPANWYEASMAEWTRFERLSGDKSCDVVVVGGGLLGVSTALHLAEAGLDVVLLEKDNIGSGASGRNGGQTTPGLARWEAETMAHNLPLDEAKRLWRFVGAEAMELLDELPSRHGFSCDRKMGHITAANHRGHMGALVENADARRYLGDGAMHVVGPQQLRELVKSDIYFGATIDNMGGQVHPLALVRGMAYGLVRSGGHIHEGTPVRRIEETPTGTLVITDTGSVTARKAVVLAVHYATGDFLAGGNTTVPFYTYVAVTPVLPMPVEELIPSGLPVYDTQLQIDYYRAVRGNRILFGGQGTGNSWSSRDVNNYLLERLRTVFPQLPDPQLEYSWGGISDITLNGAADARKSDGAIPQYLVHGWSGHGVAQTVRIGKAISDDITGRNDDFTMLTRIKHDTIPLGETLGPIAIPLVKGALTIQSLLDPSEMVSF